MRWKSRHLPSRVILATDQCQCRIGIIDCRFTFGIAPRTEAFTKLLGTKPAQRTKAFHSWYGCVPTCIKWTNSFHDVSFRERTASSFETHFQGKSEESKLIIIFNDALLDAPQKVQHHLEVSIILCPIIQCPIHSAVWPARRECTQNTDNHGFITHPKNIAMLTWRGNRRIDCLGMRRNTLSSQTSRTAPSTISKGTARIADDIVRQTTESQHDDAITVRANDTKSILVSKTGQHCNTYTNHRNLDWTESKENKWRAKNHTHRMATKPAHTRLAHASYTPSLCLYRPCDDSTYPDESESTSHSVRPLYSTQIHSTSNQ